MKRILLIIGFVVGISSFANAFSISGWYDTNSDTSIKLIDKDNEASFSGNNFQIKDGTNTTSINSNGTITVGTSLTVSDGDNDTIINPDGSITLPATSLSITDNEGNTTTITPSINGFIGDGTNDLLLDGNGQPIKYNFDSNKARAADISFLSTIAGVNDFIWYGFYDDDGTEYSRFTGFDMTLNGSPTFGTQGEMRYSIIDDGAATPQYYYREVTSSFGSGDNPGLDYSMIVVFNPDDQESDALFGVWNQTAVQQGKIGKGTGGTAYCLVGGNNFYIGRKTDAGTVVAGKWYMLVGMFDNDGVDNDGKVDIRLYNLTDKTVVIDTTDVASGTWSTPIDGTGSNLTLWGDFINSTFADKFDGNGGCAGLFHKVFTDLECDILAWYFKYKLGL